MLTMRMVEELELQEGEEVQEELEGVEEEVEEEEGIS